MCGLFTLRTRHTTIFNHNVSFGETPRYAIRPGEMIPAIRLGGSVPTVSPMKWGFRPSWAPPKRICINMRSETAATSPMFKRAFRSARCLIPADGFFEPNRAVTKRAYVWFRQPADRPFFFPGLWTIFAREGESTYETCGLLTTTPNRTVAPYHGRMPVVMNDEAAEAWLEAPGEDVERLQALLTPAADQALAAVHVTPDLYRLRPDDPASVQAVAPSS
jgi:putative SOS response-associated peptidase YedK